jgi:peptidoglycan/LPS O-acetylase OafA/YrhL
MLSLANIEKPKRVVLVECARGAAAIYVCMHHIVMIGHMADSYKWGKYVFYPFSYGEEMVSLFFFLSGFSIHYSSLGRPLDTMAGVGYYYYLRFRRIYPIFLVAVVLTITLGVCSAVAGIGSAVSYSITKTSLLYVLTFLSDWHPGSWNYGMPNNAALWSLSYEIPYYLVYPLFWMACRRFGGMRAFIASLLGSGALVWVDCIQPNHLSNVFSLYWLWTCGALMAEWKLSSKKFALSPVLYYLMLFVSYAIIQSTEAIVNPIVHRTLSALTIGLIIFSTFIGFKPVLLSMRLLAVGGLLVILVLFHMATGHVPVWGHHYFLDVRFVGFAVLLSFFLISGKDISSVCRDIARPFLGLGAISYALYVIHTPILFFVADILHHFSLSLFWLPLSALVFLPLAWWLEIRFQPVVVYWIDLGRVKANYFFSIGRRVPKLN